MSIEADIVTGLNKWTWEKDWRMGFVRFLINPFIWLAALAALAVILADPLPREFLGEELAEIILALIFARGVLTILLHFAFRRGRPYGALELMRVIVPLGHNSFPSGHAAFFAALGFVLLPIAPGPAGWLLAATAVNGLARVTGGLHWPTDVLAGFVVGYAGTWLAVEFLALG